MLKSATKAIYRCHYDFLEKMLKNNTKESFSRKMHNGATLLHVAAGFGQIRAIELLLDNGMDVDILDKDGNTAMHRAAQLGHLHVITLLAKRGSCAIPDNLTNIFGDTVMHLATQALCLGLVEAIASMGFFAMRQFNAAGFAPVHCAARSAVVENLLAFAKIDASLLEFQDAHGMTPLHHAVFCDSRPMIHGILSVSDKSMVIVDEFSRMPVHLAAACGNIEAFSAICGYDARMLCTTTAQSSFTPLHLAASNGCLEIVKHIVHREFQALLHKDSFGRVPLQLAIIGGHAEVCQYMLNVFPGVVHEQDNVGWTAYHVALHMKLPYILGLVVIATFN